VLFNENLTTLDKFIIGVVYTFPECKAEEVQQFLPDYEVYEISSKLEDLTNFNCLSKDRSLTFKIKNLLNLTYKSQKNQKSQDQENSVPAKKRIIRRGISTHNPNALIVLKELSKNNNNNLTHNNCSSSLDEEQLVSGAKTEKEKKYIPKMVQPFLDIWFISDLYIQGDSTKGFAEDIEALKKLITGRFFSVKSGKNVPYQYLDRSFSLEDWTIAVERFRKMAFDPNYLPANKGKLQKMKLRHFLYNEYGNFVGDKLNSTFLRCLTNEPQTKIGSRKAKDEKDYPKITERLIFLYGEYRKEVLGKYSYEPDETDIDRFKYASRRIIQFFEIEKEKIWNYQNEFSGKNALTDFVWAAVLHDIRNSDMELTPGFFCSNRTFEVRVPNFLKHKRYIK
jgi:hypothetical protein